MCVGNGCILRRAGECGVSVGVEQRGFVGLWQPHLRAQNIAANGRVLAKCHQYKLKFKALNYLWHFANTVL